MNVSTVIGNAKGLVNRFNRKLPLEQKPLAELQEGLRVQQLKLQAMKEIAAHMDSPEWKWLVSTFLPAQYQGISHERSLIDPKDTDTQLKKHGAQEFVRELTEKFSGVLSEIDELERSCAMLNEAISKWHRRHGNT